MTNLESLEKKMQQKLSRLWNELKHFLCSRWLYALGIQEVGETTAYEIANFHKN